VNGADFAKIRSDISGVVTSHDAAMAALGGANAIRIPV
jgi:hypothetical protein